MSLCPCYIFCYCALHFVCQSLFVTTSVGMTTVCALQLMESGHAGVPGPSAPSRVTGAIRRGSDPVDTPSTGAASVRGTSHSSGDATCDPAKVCYLVLPLSLGVISKLCTTCRRKIITSTA